MGGSNISGSSAESNNLASGDALALLYSDLGKVGINS
ncbi:uncharacterized protein METZ01_LOCUS190209 [marine metagenome]|uniref:Uncharacterized protein n=1 Tax=marine metagenome TaxID=408172 RepID=A0A382DGK0_9ZZZZ